MTKEEIDKLFSEGRFQETFCRPELIETHISWVFLCDRFVYKVKKPIVYSFLDFSTIEKRRYYCKREIKLNQRLTDDIYLDVQPVMRQAGGYAIGHVEGEIIDHAVRMRKVDRDRQMDRLLLNNKITSGQIRKLAEKIALFHNNTAIIYQKDFLDVQEKFNDLLAEKNFLGERLNHESSELIGQAVNASNSFLDSHRERLEERLKNGFFRDCHGDLHSRNIFLLASPQPFDCIEFNDELRQIDVLNEVAFLCMDLEAFGRPDLSEQFIRYYNAIFPVIKNDADQKLFSYYKSYRSNIRAKVNSLRARAAEDPGERMPVLAEADKYLRLMDSYLREIN